MMFNLGQMLAETTTATPVEGATVATGASEFISMIVMMVLMVAVFYFILIRPQRKKDKAV